MYGWLYFCGFGGQKVVHIQQFVVFGCAGQIVPRVVGGGVVVGGCAAVLSVADVRVFEQIIFQVNHRSLPTDKQNALAVIQQPHLVRGHKIAPGLLVVDAVTAAAPLTLVITGRGDGFFPQQFRDIFVGFFLRAAKVEKLVT